MDFYKKHKLPSHFIRQQHYQLFFWWAIGINLTVCLMLVFYWTDWNSNINLSNANCHLSNICFHLTDNVDQNRTLTCMFILRFADIPNKVATDCLFQLFCEIIVVSIQHLTLSDTIQTKIRTYQIKKACRLKKQMQILSVSLSFYFHS